MKRTVPWLLLVLPALALGWLIYDATTSAHPSLRWAQPRALGLAVFVLLGWLLLWFGNGNRLRLKFSQVRFAAGSSARTWLAELPLALRGVALLLLVVGLARPQTFKTVHRDIDSIDIMVVFDVSQSMDAGDMARDRLDAAQRVVRRFLRRTKQDRVGLVVFAQVAMLQCPLTSDMRTLEQIVADLQLGDVPAEGTAIGDGLALGLAQLKKSDAKSKVVILLSDGDNNMVNQFDPSEAATVAKREKIKVFTVLVGSERPSFFGGSDVNPETLRGIAKATGASFFRASDEATFAKGFDEVRKSLDKTKRRSSERVPEHELFINWLLPALLVLGLERWLRSTWLRRLA